MHKKQSLSMTLIIIHIILIKIKLKIYEKFLIRDWGLITCDWSFIYLFKLL
jgi:hypothetical protein